MRFLVILSAIIMFAAPAWAATEFFATIPDMPVAESLTDLPDQSLVYDKPSGRIVEVVAAVDGESQQIFAFYDQILPSFGWRKQAEHFYVREDEIVRYWVETFEGEAYFHMMVMPVTESPL